MRWSSAVLAGGFLLVTLPGLCAGQSARELQAQVLGTFADRDFLGAGLGGNFRVDVFGINQKVCRFRLEIAYLTKKARISCGICFRPGVIPMPGVDLLLHLVPFLQQGFVAW